MDIKIDKDLNRKMILCNGAHLECEVVIEELAELTQCITKELRGKSDIDHLVEEMADVYICLETLKLVFDINYSELQEMIRKKEYRNAKRLLDKVS